MKRIQELAMTCLAGAVLLTTGCQTGAPPPVPVELQATGDPGVTFTIASDLPDLPELQATVPATLNFSGRRFDLRCIHGPQSGRLSLTMLRSGNTISTGDMTQPGQVTLFEVRPDSISAKWLPATD